MPELTIPLNYRYWQEHGSSWPDEYEQRKKSQIHYHAQEIMLADYMAHFTPARVLEYGCGFGRHLNYLSRITGLDVYGYDQSLTMLAGFAGWARREWIRDHIALGEPVGRLPYPDDCFDIVYTAEVLVHVRPEDIVPILTELVRVAKQQVFHLETAPGYSLNASAHDGCWYHDLVQIYSELGYRCEMLPQSYQAHAPYRVLLGPARSVYSGSPLLAQQLARLESDLQPAVSSANTVRQYEQQIDELQNTLATEQALVSQLEARVHQVDATVAILQSALDQKSRAVEAIGVELAQAQSQLAQAQSQLAQAQTQIAEYSTLVKELKSVLHSASGS